MPGRNRVPSFQLASGTTNERDGSYNLTTLGSVFYNTDTSNVEVYHEDPSNTLEWRDLVMNNKEQIDISGNLVVKDDVSFNAHISAVDASFQNNVDIAGKLVVKDDVSFNAHLSVLDASFQNNVDIAGKLMVDGDVSFNGELNMGIVRKELLLAGAGGLDGTGGGHGIATATNTASSYSSHDAFNGTLTTSADVWHSDDTTLDSDNPKSLIFEFPYDVIISKYKIWPRTSAPHNPKAWTLRAYPAGPYDRMYPPTRNLTLASQTISGQTISGQAYGNGAYVTNQSEYHTYASVDYKAWYAFNGTDGVGVHFNSTYTSGSYNGSKNLKTGYIGDWLTIKLPVQINLTKYGFKQRAGQSARAPGQYKIYGSNDGSDWNVLVHKNSNIQYTGDDFEESISKIGMYNYFGLVVNQLSGSDSYLNFDEWYIYGNEYNPVEIDEVSDVTNWPTPTSDSITNDTSFNEYPVSNTTTAYRKFELNITDSAHTTYVTIGELAFYGYKQGAINTGNLVVNKITFSDGTSQTTAVSHTGYENEFGASFSYSVSVGNPSFVGNSQGNNHGGRMNNSLNADIEVPTGSSGKVRVDYQIIGEWSRIVQDKGVILGRATLQADGTFIYDKLIRADTDPSYSSAARLLAGFMISYHGDNTTTMEQASGFIIDDTATVGYTYRYTPILVNTDSYNNQTATFKLNRTIGNLSTLYAERAVSVISATLINV